MKITIVKKYDFDRSGTTFSLFGHSDMDSAGKLQHLKIRALFVPSSTDRYLSIPALEDVYGSESVATTLCGHHIIGYSWTDGLGRRSVAADVSRNASYGPECFKNGNSLDHIAAQMGVPLDGTQLKYLVF
jgi:hypothetical protein